MSGVNRRENNVSTVLVGLEPGCSISTEYEGQRREAMSATKREPILLQLGSLLRQASREQGQGSSSRSNNLQQGPITRKLNCPPSLAQMVP